MRRYLAALAPGAMLPDEAREQCKWAAAAHGLLPSLSVERGEISSTGIGVAPIGCTGLILGQFHRRKADSREYCLTPCEAEQVASTGGAELTRLGWGSYVALTIGRARTGIVRSPFGNLPALYCQREDVVFLASDLELLGSCGLDTHSISWAELARHLVAGDIRREQTCLAGILDLQGGRRLTIGRTGVRNEQVWSPRPDPQIFGVTVQDFATSVRAAVESSVAAIASSARKSLLMLSGGLDSSILAAALRRADRPLVALNLVTAEASGDERHYARMVAQSLGIELVEVERAIENVDVAKSDAAGLARPATRSFLQDTRKIIEQVRIGSGADLIIEGGGGDNVFCSLQSVAPVANLIRVRASFARVVASARDIAALTDSTFATVLRRAYIRAWWRRSGYRAARDHTFLTSDATAAAQGATEHPWLRTAETQNPGWSAYMALLIAAQGWVEGFEPMREPATECPLLAQPVIEACCAVPSWLWFSGGQNRVVAREAFRDSLPAAVIDRRSKATPDSFVTRLFEHNKPQIRELLCDGLLSSAGLIDRDLIDRCIRSSGPQRDHDHRRLMRLLDAEAWAQARTAVRSDANAPNGGTG